MLFLKTFKDAKFVVDGNAFQTFITLHLHLSITVPTDRFRAISHHE